MSNRIKSLLIVNYHDLISPSDGVGEIDESQLDVIYERLLDSAETVKPSHIIVLKESDHPSSSLEPWKQRRMPEGYESLDTMIVKMGIEIQDAKDNPIEKIVAKVANDQASEFDEVYIYDNSAIVPVLLESEDVYLPSGGSFERLYEINKSENLTREVRMRILSLKGVASRGLKGVPRITEREATKWIHEYGDLNALYKNLDKLPAHKAKNLSDNKSKIFDANQMITSDVTVDLSSIVAQEFNQAFLSSARYNKIKEARVQESVLNSEYYQGNGANVITNMDDLCEIFKYSKRHKALVMSEVEADGVLVGLAIGSGSKSDGFLEFDQSIDVKGLLNELRDFAKRENLMVVTPDGKSLSKAFLKQGVEPIKTFLDVSLVAYNFGIYEEKKGVKSLSSLCSAYQEESFETFKEFAQSKFNTVPVEAIRPEFVARYCSGYLSKIGQLGEKAKSLLNSNPSIKRFYVGTEMKAAVSIGRMEHNGIFVDHKIASESASEIEYRLMHVAEELESIANRRVSVTGTKDVNSLVTEFQEKFKKEPSIMKNRENFVRVTALVDEVLELQKNLYYPKVMFKENVNKETGRIHAQFNQKTTATGRLSCSKPSLQGVSKKFGIRDAIRSSSEDRGLIVVDYSQVELRILAHASGDRTLIQEIRDGIDLHAATASAVFGVPIEEVDSEMRNKAKPINFGIPYGQTEFGLAQEMNCTVDVAKSYLEAYDKKYPGVKKFKQDQFEFVKKNGFVRTLGGREISNDSLNKETANSKSFNVYSGANRKATNYSIQGSAADLMKLAMIAVDDIVKSYDAKIILQVHDELVIDGPKEKLPELKDKVKQVMESVMSLSVPLVADAEISDSWGEGKGGSKNKETDNESIHEVESGIQVEAKKSPKSVLAEKSSLRDEYDWAPGSLYDLI